MVVVVVVIFVGLLPVSVTNTNENNIRKTTVI
jgi:hypothetical protein